MKYLWAAINLLIPVLLLFLIFSTWIGYIAESLRDFYHFKWAAIGLILLGYMLNFKKRAAGLIIVTAGSAAWFFI
ncbi:hypothetical protein [Rossellomorea aquimaris]|uniref:Uncharacterized protein n=1 Tax=Rossellomorea aquimaris TaxID=189382 RepID=A0A1J6W0W9_9BACI|nr:hypothetical protein [Rossellomorea aquimaris]OIU71766.1 hypothetical protein BHE18_03670 [Rossellomorea aquimaris]